MIFWFLISALIIGRFSRNVCCFIFGKQWNHIISEFYQFFKICAKKNQLIIDFTAKKSINHRFSTNFTHENPRFHRFHKRNEMSFAEIDSAIILWREVLRFIIDRMKVGYSESGAIRKSNKQVCSRKIRKNSENLAKKKEENRLKMKKKNRFFKKKKV